MADDDENTVIPMWKRNLAKAHANRNDAASAEARRAKTSVKQALMNAFDKLGNEAFFLRLGNGSAEDRRCLAMIYAKLVPLEVQGTMDHSLTVKIVKQVGEREIVIDTGPARYLGHAPKDAQTGERMEVVKDDV